VWPQGFSRNKAVNQARRKTSKTVITRTTSLLIRLAIAAVILGTHSLAQAQEAKLTNIVVSNTNNDLMLYMSVEGAFRDKMTKAILSGVPATFSYIANLNQVRSFWPDSSIAEITVTQTIKYDNLKKEFVVTRPWLTDQPEVTKSFQDAQKMMSEVSNLKIIPLSALKKGEHYQLRAKAEFSKQTLPLYLHYLRFFVSFWDFQTDWYTIDFIY
jgi:hypothetical protein